MDINGDALRLRFKKRFFLHTVDRRNSNFRAILILVGEIGVITASGLIAALTFQQSLFIFVPVYVIALGIIGLRLRSFGNIVHECSHRSFVKDRKWNDLIGRALSLFLLYCFDSYRRDHLTHHQFTGDFEKDRDFLETARFELHVDLTIARWKHYVSQAFSPGVLSAYLGKVVYQSSESLFWRLLRSIYVAALIISALAALTFNPLGLIILAFWIVPLAVSLPFVGYLSDIMDHGGILRNDTDFDMSRNYVVENAFMQWLFFPRNDSYHLLHHLFPTIPTHFLPECHRILMDEYPDYAERKHSFSEWWQEFRKNDPSSANLASSSISIN